MILKRPDSWVGLETVDCVTALGDAEGTVEGLLAGKIALRPVPVLGGGQGDPVPLALCRDWTDTLPPRWYPELRALAKRIPPAPWGHAGYPIFISSSNFGVGNLLAYRQGGSDGHLSYATLTDCVDRVAELLGWGPDRTVISHACVSSHLALEQGRRAVVAGAARKALVFTFDFLSPFVAGGFHALKILNGGFPTPYQDRPEGSIGLGDGAAFAVLTPDRTAHVLSPAMLYNEMWHFTGNNPDGSGFRAMEPWLREIVGSRKIWIKGHGTGTLEAGRLESESLNALLPAAPLVSWKGSLGHTLGSCGLVEMAIALAALKRGSVPGTVGGSPPCFTPNVALESLDPSGFDGALLLANAFGGAHTAAFLGHDF